MNIYWLNPPMKIQEVVSDLGWMNFRHHCKEYNWIHPIIDWDAYSTLDSVLNHILENKTDILCISVYLWNHKLCHVVAKEIKKINPNIIVIQGGPHQGYNSNFFNEHPYIDYMCYATGHGENFLKEALLQIKENGKIVSPEKVPHMICREYQSLNEKSKYVYPEDSSFEYSIDYLIDLITYSKKKNYRLRVIYETTRGCPYGCTYCEWGGGTSTKVSIKDTDIIKKDIDIMSMLKIPHFEFTDANIGILDRDVEIAEYIGQNKLKYGYPESLHIYGVAKVKLKKKEALLDTLLKYGLYEEVSISVQTLDSKLLENLKRTDIPLEDNLYLAKKYKDMYGSKLKLNLELLLGIPGYTLDHFYEEFDFLYKYSSLDKERYLLCVLPDAELYTDFQRKLWKIKTIKIGGDTRFMDVNADFSDVAKNSTSILTDPLFACEYDIVVSTYSFTTEDWKEMFIMNKMAKVLEHKITDNYPPSKVMKDFYEEFKNTDAFLKLNNFLDDVITGKIVPKDISIVDDQTIYELMEEIVDLIGADCKWI